ncbi:metallophosphoesterase [uncultured Propionibacterium sp.]|uniref:metallophosphoesterase n=1 Tax=uncultured Propionibacterium sp. TaxID=218066 RepID=UPI00292CFB02|nr:metallophosphoesterase [uncultured Propionibacterium sp.]
MPAPARVIGAALGGTAAFGACMIGAAAEAHAFRTHHVDVPVLAPGSAPIRVLHISDIHLQARQRDKMAFLRRLADERPDLVVSTGDHITQGRAIAPLAEALTPLRGLPGVFVLGSNDYEAPLWRNPAAYLWRTTADTDDHPRVALPTGHLRERLEGLGWTDLNNASARLQVAGRTIALRGTDDPHIGFDRYEQVAGPLDPGVELTMGVTHAPYRRVLDAMVDDGIGLVLAGHTHGGQVCLPNGRAIITNCDIDPGRARGLHRWEHEGHEGWLHVSNGMGTSPFAPYRLFCRPSATLLRLVAAE